MCNNRQQFIARSLQHGLYIPHKDPEWEADEQFYNYRSQESSQHFRSGAFQRSSGSYSLQSANTTLQKEVKMRMFKKEIVTKN